MIKTVNLNTEQSQSMDGHQPLWLITFADLIGLLLVFFVLLFSMSSLQTSKLQKISEGVPGARVEARSDADALNQAMPDPQVEEGRDPGYLTSLIKAKFANDPALKNLPITGLGDRAIISLSVADLQTSIGADAVGKNNTLHALADVLRVLPNQIVVDSRLAPMGDVPDEADLLRWQKSLQAALAVSNALTQGGVTSSILARGHVVDRGATPTIDIIVMSNTAPEPAAGAAP
ncbi:MAG TPA: flagellar motor protein MotB [Dongiaceae bacterium]|nr:flagellar motor protein MotB [Dongiaceae bacterium]